ncbi:MAG TPA: dihydropteroate synthase [Pirellulales bacterium]|nr:dihydropteroate synthase [Pirellulales bacterium]
MVSERPGRRYWQLKDRRLDFPARPLVMGILNVTPDSFSDGGQFLDLDVAIARGLQLAAEGADLIDVGGESTRPYSQPVDEAEELRRVLPVVRALAQRTTVPISIDTSKAVVARAAIDSGAEIINDVTALTADERMIDTALDTRAAVCAMHMLGTPQTMQDNPAYDDVVTEVLEYLRRRRDALVAADIPHDKIALDPGIGFGKTHEHNLTLVAHAWRFHELDCPLLVGHSRKGFIGKVIGDKQADRTAGTIGVSLALARQGIQMLRVHDVAANLHALKLYQAAGGLET